MNFWQRQDKARSNTTLLVILFILSVVIIAGLVGVITYFFLHNNKQFSMSSVAALKAASFSVFFTMSAILYASACRIYELRSGGVAIAKQIGATFIGNKPQNPKWLRLRNVTTEIAIASRVVPPTLYVLEKEHALNAFAAGHNADDAIIVVTHGLLENLNRDELQAVIAHEISHILNNDIGLNLHITGFLHGLLVVWEWGRNMLDVPGHSRAAVMLKTVGFFLLVIGSLGTLAGHLIKAALSRQRELLADACAVQFTRQQDGLANALKKIAAMPQGTELDNTAMAEEFSHMFILSGVGFDRWFDSHPPIIERIKLLDPDFNAMKLKFMQDKLIKQFAQNNN